MRCFLVNYRQVNARGFIEQEFFISRNNTLTGKQCVALVTIPIAATAASVAVTAAIAIQRST